MDPAAFARHLDVGFNLIEPTAEAPDGEVGGRLTLHLHGTWVGAHEAHAPLVAVDVTGGKVHDRAHVDGQIADPASEQGADAPQQAVHPLALVVRDG